VVPASSTELGGGVEFFLVKAVEKSGGSGPIKTAVVKAEPDAGHVVEVGLSVFPALEKQGQSLLGWRERKKKSSGKRG
jgi:hypothetical protein